MVGGAVPGLHGCCHRPVPVPRVLCAATVLSWSSHRPGCVLRPCSLKGLASSSQSPSESHFQRHFPPPLSHAAPPPVPAVPPTEARPRSPALRLAQGWLPPEAASVRRAACERAGLAGGVVTPSPLGSASKLASGRSHSALARPAPAYHRSVPTPEEMVFVFKKKINKSFTELSPAITRLNQPPSAQRTMFAHPLPPPLSS